MRFKQTLHEGDSIALFGLRYNNRGTACILEESRRNICRIVPIYLQRMQAKSSEFVGKRLQIGDVAGLPKPLKTVQIHNDCEIEPMMAAEYKSVPIGPFVPFAIRRQAENPAFLAFQFLRQCEARRQTKPMPQGSRSQTEFPEYREPGDDRSSVFHPCEKSSDHRR